MKVPAKGNVPVYWTYKAGKKGFTDLLMSANVRRRAATRR